MRDASSSCPAPAGPCVLAAKTAERKHPTQKPAGTLAALLVAGTLLPTACTTSAGEAQNDPLPVPSSKLRVLVLTDIENEPDDAQSLVRFLLYVNEMDVEGLLATTSVWMRDTTRVDKIQGHIEAYREVRDNLLVHADGYPETDFLLSQVKTCRDAYGMNGVSEGNDTEGSEQIIATVDKEDDRPLWISVWGGANCLAQALWKVRETRTPEELDAFVAKLRVYTISDQDDSGPWMRQEFPNLFYVVTPSSPHDGDDYKYATWVGISGDHFHGMFEGPNFEIVDNPWLSENIRTGHGPLAARYPATAYLMEGDTPSFMNLFRNGLAGHISPSYGGWGGRYAVSQPEGESRPIWTNSDDTVLAFDGNTYTTNHATVWRWREGGLTNPDPALRRDCIELYKAAIPPARELGARYVKFWPGQDGYDYPFQADYEDLWKYSVDAVREVAASAPNIQFAIECKFKEPRTHMLFCNVATTLLAIEDMGVNNVGIVTLRKLDALLDRLDVAALREAQTRQDALAAQRLVLDLFLG